MTDKDLEIQTLRGYIERMMKCLTQDQIATLYQDTLNGEDGVTKEFTFVRSYVCLSCHETTSREGQSGDATLWIDCAKCKGPAHWCHSIPCNICEKWKLVRREETA